jgi:hypothetical protein
MNQPIEAAAYPLVAVLADKNEQIAVPGHDDYLIETKVRAACPFIDFAPIANVESDMFQSRRGRLSSGL